MNDPPSSEEPRLGAGVHIGRYCIEAQIGEGGMGQVFRAVRTEDGEVVALKVMKERWPAESEWVKRFLREARAAGEVEHERLIGVLDAGEEDGRHYLVMPYVAGQTVEQRIRAEGPLSLATTQAMVADVAAGLDALHEHGLIHRDVKASNIIFGADGSAALADFGLAKGTRYSDLTRPGQVVGTVDYLAPELIRGEPATPASDIYSLSCVVYECLCGHTPFGGRGRFQVGMAHLEEPPGDPCADRADLPERYGQVVRQALRKDPARRPPSASAFALALAQAASAKPEGAPTAHVVVVDGELAGQRFAVTDELTIGRENTDLILPDVDASRRHAVLRSSGARVEIEDLGSRNGTWVDGERVVGTVELSDGSRVRIGDTTLFVEVPRAQAPVTRVSAGAEAPPTVVPKGPAAGPTAPPATEATAPPVAPFSPPAPARARRPGVASRLWLPAGLTFATVIATAVALLVYFAAR
ncbi:MAG: FHA domain-containing protein [Actinobacteria bacterium]|nr:MAG: FHA domain-containing protein [Actinomycetota bacterium]